jgi:hypothetical protein
MAKDNGKIINILNVPRAYLRMSSQERNELNFPKITEDIKPNYLDWYTVLWDPINKKYEYRGHDKSLLRYLRLPKEDQVEFDLTIKHVNDDVGINTADRSGHMDNLLRWIMAYAEKNGRKL